MLHGCSPSGDRRAACEENRVGGVAGRAIAGHRGRRAGNPICTSCIQPELLVRLPMAGTAQHRAQAAKGKAEAEAQPTEREEGEGESAQ